MARRWAAESGMEGSTPQHSRHSNAVRYEQSEICQEGTAHCDLLLWRYVYVSQRTGVEERGEQGGERLGC